MSILKSLDEKVNEIYATLGDHLDYDLVCRALKESSGDVETAIDYILEPPVPKLEKKLSSKGKKTSLTFRQGKKETEKSLESAG